MDLRADHLALVERILAEHVPGVQVRAFGSRVVGRARPHSDLDLALMAPAPVALPILARLALAFEESDLPFRVDLVDWARTSEPFRRVIASASEPLQAGPAGGAAPQDGGGGPQGR
jgi:predicted nucleotidyltransferase